MLQTFLMFFYTKLLLLSFTILFSSSSIFAVRVSIGLAFFALGSQLFELYIVIEKVR